MGKDDKILQLSEDLKMSMNQNDVIREELQEYVGQISQLNEELNKRNSDIIKFISTLKKMRERVNSPESPGYLINADVFDTDLTELSWDHGFESIFEPTKDLIERLIKANHEKSKIIDSSYCGKDEQVRSLEE